jgi:hypothetical protein
VVAFGSTAMSDEHGTGLLANPLIKLGARDNKQQIRTERVDLSRDLGTRSLGFALLVLRLRNLSFGEV